MEHQRTPESADIEISVLIPCLNEAETLGICIEKCTNTFREYNISGEVVVADNGSTDGSLDIATAKGARVVHVPQKGYGAALQGGIAGSHGHFIIMGDADDSYDFREIPRFLEKLRAGSELVLGCRLPSGGGRVMPGAMPWLHRWIGNPGLSFLVRWWFRAPIHDVYCGLRGFTKSLYERLDQRCTGMEFATEMVIKSSLFNARITEVPITLHPDGRKTRKPHLRTFHDGWRTLRFFLIYSPKWLFLVPGLFFIALGMLGYALALPRLTIGSIRPDAHTLLFASLTILVGYQSIQFGILAKAFAVTEGLLPHDKRLDAGLRLIPLERGIMLGLLFSLVGTALLGVALRGWQLAGFGDLDYAKTMRIVVPGITLCALGAQTIMACFLLNLLGTSRR